MKKQERQYEITFLASEEGLDQEVKKIIESLEGKVEETKVWGRQKLAYPIKGHNAANYTTVIFTAAAEKLLDFDKKIKLIGGIIRHLTVVAIPKSPKIAVIKEERKEERIEKKLEKKPKIESIKTEKIKTEDVQEEEKNVDERLKKLDEKLNEILAE